MNSQEVVINRKMLPENQKDIGHVQVGPPEIQQSNGFTRKSDDKDPNSNGAINFESIPHIGAASFKSYDGTNIPVHQSTCDVHDCSSPNSPSNPLAECPIEPNAPLSKLVGISTDACNVINKVVRSQSSASSEASLAKSALKTNILFKT